MRIAIAQINSILGNFEYNSKRIIEYTKKALERHCDLVVFPESSLFGYHPFDLLERELLIDHQLKYLKAINQEIPKGITVIFGLFTKNKNKKGRPYYNSACVLEKGKNPIFFNKQLLPTGDVFDEARFIQSGSLANNQFKVKGKKIFLTICEDIWAWDLPNQKNHYEKNPIENAKKSGIDLVINLSASPFYPDKFKIRHQLVAKTAKYFNSPMVYCNLVGAQDEIVFDGRSFCTNKSGKILGECLSFQEDLVVIDLNKKQGNQHHVKVSLTEELRKALVLGIQDFCTKARIEKVHLGLSGGIDSALVACLAVDALGPSKVRAFAMPGPFSSDDSYRWAKILAENLGIDFSEVSINSIYEQLNQTVNSAFQIHKFSTVHENLQARIRGMLLMAYANSSNSLLLSTSNKSEYATGYSTLYGDMCGGLAPIGDLTKKQVYELSQHYNIESELIPKQIIQRPPSAELRPNQKDEDSLPKYQDLDLSVSNLVENGLNAKTSTDKWLLPVLLRTEFKRWQAPPILKVSKHSFGRGRRFPIAHQAKEL
jgi:NAD+ synthase (glutamine-hydrolysing)